MKRTQLLVLFRNIWSTRVQFFSIALFVALGIGFFLGMKWNEPAFVNTVDRYYEEHTFLDFNVSSPYGLTDEDIAAIMELDSYAELEGSYTATGISRVGARNYLLTLLSVTEKLNSTEVLEGRLPASAGEVGIEKEMAENTGLGIGDKLVIEAERNGISCLIESEFIITGIVEHPAYISLEINNTRGYADIGDGKANYYLLLSDEAFNKAAYGNSFSNVYIRFDSLRGLNSFGDEYKAQADIIAAELEELGNTRGLARYQEITERYQQELTEAERFDHWIVEKRENNASYQLCKLYSQTGQKLCYSMALLFVFVAVMICYTSISRFVQERQVLIGVQKSFGFNQREIIMQYMAYAVLTVALGSVFGGTLGYFGIEQILNASFEKSFVVGEFISYFSWMDMLLIFGAELVMISLAAWLACYKQLSRRALDLLHNRGGAVRRTRFYEKWRLWQRCSLYTQMIVNNLMNDKMRIVATLVGVIGCTGLVVMSMTVRSSVLNTPQKHFSDIAAYDLRLVAIDDSAASTDGLRAVLEEQGVNYTPIMQTIVLIEDADGKIDLADLIVPMEPETFSDFRRLKDSDSGDMMTLSDDGIMISHPYVKKYPEVTVGSELKLIDIVGNDHPSTIAGVTEHYLLAPQIVMSPAYYESLTGDSPRSNAFYIQAEETQYTVLEEKLRDVQGFMYLADDPSASIELFHSYQQSITLMVGICLVLSIVIALLVLLNLNIIIINEKVDELIIMRINGFSVGRTKRYVYQDNIVLTALGIVLGVGVGVLLARFVIYSISKSGTDFITDPDLTACLAGALVSAVFALITNLITLRRVGKLRASDLKKL